MKKFIIPIIVIACFVNCGSGYTLRARVKIQQPQLKQFQQIAKVNLPLPEKGYVYVADTTGLKVPCIRVKSSQQQRDSIYFKTNENDIYYVYWLSEEKKQETGIFEIPDGRVILDDFVNPSARTSGFWYWSSHPCLSGRFSHSGRSSQKINSHYTAITPGEKLKPLDIFYQYVFIDKNQPASEIMLEIQTQKRKSIYFSWGSDIIKWKNLNKIHMGELPEAGKWIQLLIPVDKIDKGVEITGIGFYHADGRVLWDYTTIGNPPLEANILQWNQGNKKINAFFDSEIFGPFAFSEKVFNLVLLNASASSGADTFEWFIEGQKYSGDRILKKFDSKDKTHVMLTSKSMALKQSDTFSETIVFQKKSPEQLNLFLEILPHKNLINQGERFFVPVRVGSLISGIVPVELSIDGHNHLLKLFPGQENSEITNVFYSPETTEIHDIEIKLDDLVVAKKNLRFVPVDHLDMKHLDGPYLRDENNNNLVAFIPDYKYSDISTETQIKQLTVIGDIPENFLKKLKEKLSKNIEIKWLKYPETQAYHAISNVLWLKQEIENRNMETVILFPSIESLLRRTPIDQYIVCLDAEIWFLSKKARKIICVGPFPSAPIPEMFKIYADATVDLCKKRNVTCLNLYDLYTSLPDWTELFSPSRGIYKIFPSEKGLGILIDEIIKIVGASRQT
ncbi:MAG TPA: hypothetical protein PK303_03950 [bacterium]|nr:hypothetical protein [bacterium]HOL34799.1 hypothetical protein [bacterium]HPP08258.1 hypothetical protein [bacterium]